MSERETDIRPLRTVTRALRDRSDTEMNVVGLSLALGLVILLVPMLPFIVIVWLISRGIERARARRAG